MSVGNFSDESCPRCTNDYLNRYSDMLSGQSDKNTLG